MRRSLNVTFIIFIGLNCFAQSHIARSVKCSAKSPNTTLIDAIKSKRMVFIGEAHSSRSAKLVSEADLMEQFCHVNRPIILLTEFLWPRWQSAFDDWLKSPSDSLKSFVVENIRDTKFNSDEFINRFTDFFQWTKNRGVYSVGIDLDNFGSGKYFEIPSFDSELLKSVAAEFEISDYMVDRVEQRDINFAIQSLAFHRKLPSNALIIVYLGSNHVEKVPTLISHQIPLSQMLSIHIGGADLPNLSLKIQIQEPPTDYSPQTIFLGEHFELEQSRKYSRAVQKIIHISPTNPYIK